MPRSIMEIAKRLVEILEQMGHIRKEGYGFTERYDMSLPDYASWIQVLTEAIAIYKAEELEEKFKKAGLKK